MSKLLLDIAAGALVLCVSVPSLIIIGVLWLIGYVIHRAFKLIDWAFTRMGIGKDWKLL